MIREREARPRRPTPAAWGLHLALGVVMGVLTCVWAGQAAQGAVEAALDARLLAAGAGVNAGLVGLERRQMALVRAVEFTQGLPDRLARRDVGGLQELAEPLQGNSSVPMLDLIDTGGEVLLALRSLGAPPPASSRRDWRAVRQALGGQGVQGDERITDLVVGAEEGPLLVTAGPVRAGDQIVGAAVAATPLGDALGELANLSQAELTAYDSTGAPLATSLDGHPPQLGAWRAQAILGSLDPPVPRPLPLGGTVQRELLGRLILDHRPVAVLGVALPDGSTAAGRVVTLEVGAGLAATALTLAALAARLGRGASP